MRLLCFLAAILLGMSVLLDGPRAAEPPGDARPEGRLPATAMPRDHPGPRPRPRTTAEVKAVLAGAPRPTLPTRKVRVVLVAGKKDHGKGEHDYPAWQKAWAALFRLADRVEVGTAWEWPAREEFGNADVLVFYQHGDWTPQRAADVDGFLDRGGGLVYIHWAVDGRADAPGFAQRIGLASRGGKIKYRHGPLDLSFNQDVKHPIARNFDRLHLVDESYWMLTGKLPANRVLATAVEDREPRPLFWTLEHARGRVFVTIPGHYSWTFDDPLYRVLLLRGIAWAVREPIDRFNDLVWPGADVTR
jgi:Trehalose utilisation